MKAFIVALCIAAAAAEADPALVYTAGYPTVYAHQPAVYAHQPLVYHAAPVAPIAHPAVAGGYAAAGRYVAKAAGVGAPVHIAKRDADADAEPWYVVSGYPTAYAAYQAHPVAYRALYNNYVSTYGVNAAYVPYTAYNTVAAVHTVGKRDADAEPWYAIAGYPTAYAAYQAHPVAYAGLYNRYVSTYGLNAAYVPYAAATTTYTAPAVAVHTVGKREADAEPWYVRAGYPTAYAAYTANPVVYGGLYRNYVSTYGLNAAYVPYTASAYSYYY
jgi:hypothetical protein